MTDVPATPPAARDKKKRARLVFLCVAGVALVGFGARALLTAGHETTDDAQIEGHVVTITARVPGQIARVLVSDNQRVEAGQPLVELDDVEYAARLRAAEADVAAARAGLAAAEAQAEITARNGNAGVTQARGALVQAAGGVGASKAQLEQARADVKAAEAKRDLARSDLDRSRALLAQGAVAQAEFDARQSAFDQADAALVNARARLKSNEKTIESSAGALELARGRLDAAQTVPTQVLAAGAAVDLARARLEQSEAALVIARTNLEFTKVRAPSAGVVSKKSAEAGQMVGPERALLAIVSLPDTWVVANFKEDQIAELRPGSPARVRVDAYGGRAIKAHVESVSGATGARFSLLPPDNASGNFVKVVQRVPVLVRLDERPEDVVLRPGLSVNVDVDTRADPVPLTGATAARAPSTP